MNLKEQLNLQLSLVSGFWFQGFMVSWFHPNRDRDRYRDRLFNHGTRRTHGKAWLFSVCLVCSVVPIRNCVLHQIGAARISTETNVYGALLKICMLNCSFRLNEERRNSAGVQCSIDSFAAVCNAIRRGRGFRRRIQSVPQRPHKVWTTCMASAWSLSSTQTSGAANSNASGDYKPDRVAELVSDVARIRQLQQHAELITLGDVWRRKNFIMAVF